MKSKSLYLILFLTFSLLSSRESLCQVDIQLIVQSVSYQLESGDLDKIDKADRSIQEANQMSEDLIEEDQRIQKYFRKKEKKGEKKSVDAKQYRIDMTRKYSEGLGKIFDILSERLNFAIFEYPEDQTTANNHRSEAEDLFKTAKQNFSTYSGLEKKQLKDFKYYTMISELETIVNLQLSGLEKLVDAFAIWATQTEKKQKEMADENGWATAVDLNSIDGYNEYITQFPAGKYLAQAKSKIEELEEQARLDAEAAAEAERKRKEEEERQAELERQRLLAEQEQQEDAPPTGLTYKIQIMAVYFQVDQERLKKIYSGEEEIIERFEDGMYKYTIGEFTTFNEAKDFRKMLSIPSFIVAFQDGERIPTIEAKKMETTHVVEDDVAEVENETETE